MDEWSLIKSDDHDMAEAILLTEEIMNAVMDMVRVMVRITERSESSLYWTNHVSDVRPRSIEKPSLTHFLLRYQHKIFRVCSLG